MKDFDTGQTGFVQTNESAIETGQATMNTSKAKTARTTVSASALNGT
ncbi:MAG TPA: hypothetical protein VHB93_02055 [Candidatus Paceibacterota bacterium]|nr:hypothetical protein [Candidatus Paceibacterota bacterium]